MELYIIRVGIREEQNTTISRLVSGLRIEMRDRMELLPSKIWMIWYNYELRLNNKFEKKVLQKRKFSV